MKLSTRARYGMRAMTQLAENYDHGPIPLRIIASQQGIPIKYLEQLIVPLRNTGLVRSVRGPHGGYALARSPAEIKLSWIFDTLEGPLLLAECLDDKTVCNRSNFCVTKELWAQIHWAIMELLESLTLGDLINKRGKNFKLNYQI